MDRTAAVPNGGAGLELVTLLDATRSSAGVVWTGDHFLLIGGSTAGSSDSTDIIRVTLSGDQEKIGDLPFPYYGGAAAWTGQVALFVAGTKVIEVDPQTGDASHVATLDAGSRWGEVAWLDGRLWTNWGPTMAWYEPSTGATGVDPLAVPGAPTYAGLAAFDGWLYVVGGNKNDPETTIWAYSPESGASTKLAIDLPVGAYQPAVVPYAGMLLAAGGMGSGDKDSGLRFLFQPQTGQALDVSADMGVFDGHAAVTTADGAVYAFGGADFSGGWFYRKEMYKADPLADLPRFKLGEDFTVFPQQLIPLGTDRRAFGDFCVEDLVNLIDSIEARAGELEPLVDDAIDFTLPQMEALELYRDVKETLDRELGLSWCITGSISWDHEDAVARPDGYADAWTVGVGIDLPVPTKGLQLPKIFKVLRTINDLSSVGQSATVGLNYVLEPACHEQSTSWVPATVAFDYGFQAEVETLSLGAEYTNAFARVDVGGMAPLGTQAAPWLEDNVQDLSTWSALVYGHHKEIDINSANHATNTLAQTGLQSSYARLTTGSINFGAAGLSAHRADAYSGDNGLRLDAISVDFKDFTAPDATFDATGSLGRSEWFTSDVSVTASATDSQSCVIVLDLHDGSDQVGYVSDPWNPQLAGQVVGDGVHDLTLRAENGQGEKETQERTVRIDTTPPSSDAATFSGAGQNGWWSTCVGFEIDATDATSGAAESFSHRTGDGLLQASEPQVCQEGAHPFTYWSWDVAGNAELPNNFGVVKIDRTAPNGGTGMPEGTKGVDDWYRSCVDVPIAGLEIHPAGVNEVSGLDEVLSAINDGGWTDVGAQSVCTEGENEVHVQAFDVAGNADVVRSTPIKIDMTDPQVELDPPLASIGSTVDIPWDATDDRSGLYDVVLVERSSDVGVPATSGTWSTACTSAVSGTADAGSCSATLPGPGVHCFRAHARDKAGNTAISPVSCLGSA